MKAPPLLHAIRWAAASRSRVVVAALSAMIAVGGFGCSGYRFGTRSMFRTDVRTVHIPMIESDSFRRQLGERLTEALVKEIELNSPYKVVGDPNRADSQLRCRLLSDRKQVMVETGTDEPRALELQFVVQVDWVDRQGQTLIQRTEVPMPSSLLGISQGADFIPEVGQSVATAQQASIEGLARQIVGQLEAAW
jgi:hypothetical protein